MNLKLLNEAIAHYKSLITSEPERSALWKWETQRIFQAKWDIDELDFYSMFDSCLQNSTTRRLWHRENYEPKVMMLQFIRMNREFVRDAFRDLFNENKSVDGRMNRFIYHCDEMLREYQETNPLTRYNSHFHNDNYQLVSIYLSFRYPAIYTPYDFESFIKLMELLGSRNVPKFHDTERFFKTMRTLLGLLSKDAELIQIHQERLNKGIHYTGESLLLVEDFYRRIIQEEY
jgi:hypothetical protein